MSKPSSSYLLLMTLAFATAHAPTLQLWRSPPNAQAGSLEPFGAAPLGPNDLFAALHREYAEDDEIKRFQLDELYLPNLDVSLPELFEWSDINRTYLADTGLAQRALVGFPLDSSHGAALRMGSLGVAFAIGGDRALSRNGASIAPSSVSHDESFGTSTESSEASKRDSNSSAPQGDEMPPDDGNDAETQLAGDETRSGSGDDEDTERAADERDPDSSDDTTPSFAGDSRIHNDPFTDPPPVQVPVPGTFGLFALGLAGLYLANREKNRSG
jgi:hypothetical protein